MRAHDAPMSTQPHPPSSPRHGGRRRTATDPRPSGAVPSRRARLGLAALGALALAASTALCPSAPASAQAKGSTLFTALGETQTATIPDGALGAYFLVDGGGGGGGYDGLGPLKSGGSGASVTGTLLLEPDDVLTIDVGSQGVSASVPIGNPAPAWGGDAPGGTSYGSDSTVGGGGGGASSVLLNGEYQFVAGGGGGGGGDGTLGGIDAGGAGGVGGANGTGSSGKDGSGPGHGHGGAVGGESGMAGGAGAPEHDKAGPGGGGGGGWKGGSGGTGGGTGGGGGGGGGAGSSYLGPAVLSGGSIFTAPQPADGQVLITWIFSPVCLEASDQMVSAAAPTQFALPCSFQGVPGTEITFTPAEHGSLSIVDVANGTVEYTPLEDGWVGTDQFSYEITNANGASTTGAIAILTQGTWPETQVSSSTASPGDEVDVTASGLKPGEKVKVQLRSEPVLLTEGQADDAGEVHATVTIPDDAEAGDHHIEVLGEESGSRLTPITVTADKGTTDAAKDSATDSTTSDGTTPWGAIALAGLLVAAIGAGVALAVRSRGRSAAAANDPEAVTDATQSSER